MLFRCVRWMSGTQKSPIESFNVLKGNHNWENRLSQLTNPNIFTKERLTSIIRSLYLIGTDTKLMGIKINWMQDKSIAQGLNNLYKFVPEMNKHQTILLIRNLAILRIKEHEIWDLIEKNILEHMGDELTASDLVILAQTLLVLERSNPLL